MATLYELSSKYKYLENVLELDPTDEEIKAELEKLDDDIEIKADGYARIIAGKEAHVDALDKEIARLTAAKNKEKKHIDWLKSNLMEGMKATNKLKFKTDLFSFSVAKNGGKVPLVVDVEPEKLPSELQKVTVEADKTKIRDYMNETGDFSYAHFGEVGTHLNIR